MYGMGNNTAASVLPATGMAVAGQWLTAIALFLLVIGALLVIRTQRSQHRP